MDRFNEQSAADLSRSFSFRRDREREYDEDGTDEGSIFRLIQDDPLDYETAEEPMCAEARRIAYQQYGGTGTVEQYARGIAKHKETCPYCGQWEQAGGRRGPGSVTRPHEQRRTA